MSSTPPTEATATPPEAPAAGADAPDTHAEQPTKRGEPNWLVKAVATAVVGVVVVTVAGVAKKLISHTDPSGEVGIEQVLRDQTLPMFLGQATEPGPNDRLGLTLDVSRNGEHVKTNGCRLVWTLLDADVPTEVVSGQPAKDVRPDPKSCVTQTRMWIPLTESVSTVEHLAVRVELFAGDHLLDSAVSEPIPLG
jgi:hypothetical protein